MTETTPSNPMDEDMQHLEENLHRLAAIARTLARDVDAIDAHLWNEPYAYRAALAAIKASRNLRAQLENRWLITPLDEERPAELDAEPVPRKQRKKRSYPHVIPMGVDGQ